MSTIRCHTVPQFYLNYFIESNSNCLWVYDKKDVSFRGQSPINTTVIGDYYLSSPDADGKKDTRMEKFLSIIEALSKPILDKWIKNPPNWQEEDKHIIAMFLSFMYSRAPRSIESAKEINQAGLDYVIEEMQKLSMEPAKLKKHYEEFCKVDAKNAAMSYDEFADFMSNPRKNFKLGINEKHAIGDSFSIAEDVFYWLMQMHWCICGIKGKHFFITSDAPLNVFVQTDKDKAIFGGGFALPNVEIAFPLSSKLCLFLDKRSTEKYKHVYSDFVSEINNRTVHMAERFVISPYCSNKIYRMIVTHPHNYGKPKIDSELFKERFRQHGVDFED